MRALAALSVLMITCGILMFLGKSDGRVSMDAAGETIADFVRDADQIGLKITRISDAEEAALGRRLAAPLAAGVVEPAAQQRIDVIGQKLVPQVRRKAIPYTFTLVDDFSVNAFALPGGQIFVCTGLLAYVQSDAELASVLGHEISHVDLRHSVERVQYQERFGRHGLQPMGSIADLLRSPLVAGYAKYQEEEADLNGLRMAAAAGYDPAAGADLMARMARDAGASGRGKAKTPIGEVAQAATEKLTDYWNTHPDPADRARRLRAAAAGLDKGRSR